MKPVDESAHPAHDVSQEHEIRVQKVKKLQELGIDPWGPTQPVTASSITILQEFVEDNKKEYSVAGRIMTSRLHGKTGFAHIQDNDGRLQLYVRQDVVGQEQFELWKHFFDIGDIIWAKGTSFKTKTGEITLNVQEFKLLSKCLHPLPEKFHGLTDIETRYRQRYLDSIMDAESRKRFVQRSKIVQQLRSYLDNHGYMEVETPMLHPIAGGAAAKPFITHHNALDSDFYLRIAPELYLKRLLVGGFERVYEINRNFRNEGISTRHNPEFTMLEFYTAYHDYQYAMDFVETMLKEVVQASTGALQTQFGPHLLDFSQPFRRITMVTAVAQAAGCSPQDLEACINDFLATYKVSMPHKNASVGQKIFALFEHIVEPTLIQPTFVIDFPIEVSPLAKKDPQHPAYAARYELFIAGMELANSFNELNDPFEQAERFHQQLQAYEQGDHEAHQFDAEYVTALEYALPPAVGVGIGIDRLAMIVTNATSIKDVILFPTLKKKR